MNRLLELLRKLPVARFIKPLWKGALKYGVRLGFDLLQKEVAKIEAGAPEKIKAAILRVSKQMQERILALPLPEGIENKMVGVVAAEASELCARVDAAGDSDSALHAINQAIESAENIVLGRIDAL